MALADWSAKLGILEADAEAPIGLASWVASMSLRSNRKASPFFDEVNRVAAMSQRAHFRHRGVAVSAIQKAIEEGASRHYRMDRSIRRSRIAGGPKTAGLTHRAPKPTT